MTPSPSVSALSPTRPITSMSNLASDCSGTSYVGPCLFQTRAAGQTVARMRELENIRAFLTGQAQILQYRIEEPDQHEPGNQHVQRRVALVREHFVDDDLEEDRRDKCEYLMKKDASSSLPRSRSISRLAFSCVHRCAKKVKEKFNRGAASQQFLVSHADGEIRRRAANAGAMGRAPCLIRAHRVRGPAFGCGRPAGHPIREQADDSAAPCSLEHTLSSTTISPSAPSSPST
jgi:hypothetical protein